MSELEWVEDEASLLTEEEWDKIIAWHRKRMGKIVSLAHIPIVIDPVLPNDTLKIGNVTLTNIHEDTKIVP